MKIAATPLAAPFASPFVTPRLMKGEGNATLDDDGDPFLGGPSAATRNENRMHHYRRESVGRSAASTVAGLRGAGGGLVGAINDSINLRYPRPAAANYRAIAKKLPCDTAVARKGGCRGGEGGEGGSSTKTKRDRPARF